MTTPVTLTFLGAAGTVTGSKFLVRAGSSQVLVDAGLFQGTADERRLNWEPASFDPASLTAVVLTHAHLDHCGYLPILAREGFTGPVICTEDTASLAAIVLRDAAHLQEREAQWARESGTSKHAHPRPLFDTRDAERALALFAPVPVHRSVSVGSELRVELFRAGHILGSTFAAVTCGSSRVVFSGDLGRPDHPLLNPPESPGTADYFVVESTYGDRRHEDRDRSELAAALTTTIERGGTALLPSFAVDRTPMVLYEIHRLVRAGLVPNVPVYVDSPMALRALKVYQARLSDDVGGDFRAELHETERPFDPGKLHLVPSPEESARLNDPKGPCILISASGMATGGRVLHHLKHQLPRQRNTVIITGYQAYGTRGRALADGATSVKIHGRYIPVRAQVVNLRNLSSHADSDQMIEWLRQSPPPRTVFVVHGEPAASRALADRMEQELGWTAVVPRLSEKVRID